MECPEKWHMQMFESAGVSAYDMCNIYTRYPDMLVTCKSLAP